MLQRHFLSVALSPDGRHIVSGSDDKTIWLRSVERGERLLIANADSPVYSCAIASDSVTVLAGDLGGGLHHKCLEE